MPFRAHQDAARHATWRLLLLFALALLGLLVAANVGLAVGYRLSFPWAEGYPRFFFETNTGLLLLFVLGGWWFEVVRLREGGAHVARMAGGRCVSEPGGHRLEPGERRFVNVVDELAIACRMPHKPQAWVLPDEDAINAFAAGWAMEDSVVAVTRGALERLTRDELQGVVAHEFSHLLHGDNRLNMRLVGMVWGLQMIHTFGMSLIARGAVARPRPAFFIFGAVLVGVGSLGWIAGRLLKAAVSRQREFLADASAVQFTRSFEGIGGALRKIAYQNARRQHGVRHPQAESLSHLFLASWLRWSWFATHPPLAERLRRLYGRAVHPLPALPVDLEEEDLEAPTLPASILPDGFSGSRSFPVEALGGQPLAFKPGAAPTGLPPAAAAVLDRLPALHTAAERQAAVLALLLDAQDAEELAAWRAETRELPQAPRLLDDVLRLAPAARLPALEELLRAFALLPGIERRRLLDAARRVMGADGHLTPLDRLRWVMMRHLLGTGGGMAAGATVSALADMADAVRVASAFLARVVVPEPRAGAWWRVVMQVLQPGASTPPRGRPSTAELARAMHELARVPPAERPVLMRTWSHAALQSAPGRPLEPDAADALRMMGILLDTHMPAAVAGQYIRDREPVAGAGLPPLRDIHTKEISS